MSNFPWQRRGHFLGQSPFANQQLQRDHPCHSPSPILAGGRQPWYPIPILETHTTLRSVLYAGPVLITQFVASLPNAFTPSSVFFFFLSFLPLTSQTSSHIKPHLAASALFFASRFCLSSRSVCVCLRFSFSYGMFDCVYCVRFFFSFLPELFAVVFATLSFSGCVRPEGLAIGQIDASAFRYEPPLP